MTWLSDKIKVFTTRLIVCLGGMAFLFLILALRIYYLQIIEGKEYKILSDKNRISFQILSPQRGRILDRNGVPIAVNKPNHRSFLIPENLHLPAEKFLKRYASLVPLSEDEQKRILKDIKHKRRFMPVLIQEDLSFENRVKLELNLPDLTGLMIEEGVSRYYPMGEIFAHPVGYLSFVSSDDNTYNDPLLEIPQFKIGKSGIEQFYERRLRGEAGFRKIEVNALGREMRELDRKPPKNGEDLVLTLDAGLQRKAYRLIEKMTAAMVLLDVETGEVLAMVSAPAFNPNLLQEQWRDLIMNPFAPLMNKTITGLYSPGSTFKMMTGLSALEAKVIRRDTKVFCAGSLKVGNHTFYDWNRYGHGNVNLRQALKTSCDVFFYQVAPEVGMDRIATMAERFGLGVKTGIDLPHEKEGNIPTRNWKAGRHNEVWRPGDTVNAGIGQGYVLTTPLQLARMTAQIANGGQVIFPHILKGLTYEKKNLAIPKSHMAIIKDGMYAVVNEKYGTAYHSRFQNSKETMSGKTGTTQVRRISAKQRENKLKQKDIPYEERDHALFVGFAPSRKPKYAVAVIVEHGGGGSSVAAPLASALLEEALRSSSSKK